jgi:cytochrome c
VSPKARAIALFLGAAPGLAAAQPAGPWGGLPPGEARPVVYAYCSGCHSTRLIMQQGMSRARWDETLDWMVAKQGMAEPSPEVRESLLDYLAEHFPEQRQAPGGVSPYRTLPPLERP